QSRDDRAEDERQEPGEEEDEDRVAERVEHRGDDPDEGERQDDRPEHEQCRQQRALSIGQLERRHVAGIVVCGASPPLPADRQVNAQKIGTTSTWTTTYTAITAMSAPSDRHRISGAERQAE